MLIQSPLWCFIPVIMAKCNLASAGGSTPPTKKDKHCELCVSCKKKQISQYSHSLFCEYCCEWEHRSCSGVSSEVYNILSSDPFPNNIMFLCSHCRPKATSALKFFNEIQDKHAELEERLVQLETKLMQLNSGSRDSVTPSRHADVINNSQHSSRNQLPTQLQGPVIPPKRPQMVSSRKFNVR